MNLPKEITITIDGSVFNTMPQLVLGTSGVNTLTGEALSLFKWALVQKQKGRSIVSIDSDGILVERVQTPALKQMEPKQQAA